MPARYVKEVIEQIHLCDFRPRLNTSSYVNVVSEPEEKQVAILGAEVNLADASVYPASVKLHDHVVDLLAKLWNAPEPPIKGGHYCGAGTVGSTEACLLAGLALKFRWRKWYAERYSLEEDEVSGIKPNIVISTAYQAAWEKFFRYFDVTPILVHPNLLQDKMAVDAKKLVSHCNEKTIAVVAILGNHYNGVYDPVWDIDAEVQKLNEANGWQVGIHVDGASGGFIAPFQTPSPPPFDFRLPNVMSISSSGHKFGESICGTGWVVFRERKNLAEHIAVSVTYLGGQCDSITLNFSRPASGPYVQYYKLLRLGRNGYSSKVSNQMSNAAYIRNFLRELKHPSGKPRFQILDGGDDACLPVVAARLNPDIELTYDDIDLQHALSATHWYVSGYNLGFENFEHGGKMESLFSDVDAHASMFRVVCKSNLTRSLAEDLTEKFVEVLNALDSLKDGYKSLHSLSQAVQDEAVAAARAGRMSISEASTAALAAGKWLGKARENIKARAEEKARPRPTRRLSVSHTVC
jgi:glutamate decarboxylase